MSTEPNCSVWLMGSIKSKQWSMITNGKILLLMLVFCLLLTKWQTVFITATRNIAQLNILWGLYSHGATGKFRQAIQLLSNTSELDSFPRTLRMLGYAYYYLEDINNAKKAWCRANNMGPEVIVNGNRARFAGQLEESLVWYGLAAECDPQALSSAFAYQALTYLALNNQDEMNKMLIEAIKHDSGWVDDQSKFLTWYYLGIYYSLHQQNVEAESAITKALASLPKVIPQGKDLSKTVVSEAYRVLGTSQWEQGKGKQALSNLRLAISMNDNNPWAHIHYGKVLYLMDSASAPQTQLEFQKAITLRPSDKALWKNLIGFWIWVKDEQRTEELCLAAKQKTLLFPLLCDAPK